MCPATYCNGSLQPNVELVVGAPDDWAVALEKVTNSSPPSIDSVDRMLSSMYLRVTKRVAPGVEITLPYKWDALPQGQGTDVIWDLTWDQRMG